jgi:hypothetical protein
MKKDDANNVKEIVNNWTENPYRFFHNSV